MIDRKKNICRVAVALIALAIIVSCSQRGKKASAEVVEVSVYDNSRLEAVPYRDSTDAKKWGLIALDGTVVVAPRYDRAPSNVVNGVFVVENDKGLLEYFVAGSEPKKIGGEYTRAGLFYEDVAPCVEQGTDYVQYIKKDGSLAFRLDSIDGKKVSSVGRFWNGYATYETDGLFGYIDTKGRKITAAKFLKTGYFSNDNVALVVDTLNGNSKRYKDDDNYTIRLIDTSGKYLAKQFTRNDSVGRMFSMGVIQCGEMAKDSSGYIRKFVDKQGNTIIPANEKYRTVSDMRGTHFAYYDGDTWGIADNQTTDIIDPTLEDVIYAGETAAAVKKHGIYKLIDYSGEPISRSYATMEYLGNDQHFIASKDGKYWIVDINGAEQTEPLGEIKNNE